MISNNKICYGVIIVFIIIIGVVFLSGGIFNNDSSPENFVAETNVTAKSASISLTDTIAAEKDTFVAKSEDSRAYYGEWANGHNAIGKYEVKFTVDLNDVKWDISPTEYSDVEDSDLNKTLITNYVNNIVVNNLSTIVHAYYDYYDNSDNESGWVVNSVKTSMDEITIEDASIKIEDNILTFSGNGSTEDAFSGKDLIYTLALENEDTNSNIYMNIVIPADSINSQHEVDNSNNVGEHTNYQISTSYK